MIRNLSITGMKKEKAMNIWDKTELEAGKIAINNLMMTKNSNPILLMANNKVVVEQLQDYAREKLINVSATREEIMHGRAHGIKICRIYLRSQLNKTKEDIRLKKIPRDAINKKLIEFANVHAVDLHHAAKFIVRQKTGIVTGLAGK